MSDTPSRDPLRDRAARELFGDPWSLAWVVAVCLLATLVGVRFYAETLPQVPTLLWPLYVDSPVATLLAVASLCTLLPFVAGSERRPITEVPRNRPLAYLHTLAFVWLVTFGIWPAVALGFEAGTYLAADDALWSFWGIIVTHLLFVGLALLIPAYGATTPGALGVALALGVANVVVDYGFGYHPPLLYEPGLRLAAATLGITVGAVALAASRFDRLRAAGSEADFRPSR